ncbi:MAG: roadblock/LC7 domain-containing protein [Nitriliruptoraceae bacterium]
MSETRAERLADALDVFLRACPEVEALAVSSGDGLPMVTALPAGMDEDHVSAVMASLLALAERTCTAVDRGRLRLLWLEADEGGVCLMAAGRRAVLAAVVDVDAKAGMILHEMRRAASRIGEALDEVTERTGSGDQ